MKLSFSAISSFGDLLLVSTVAAIALSYPVGVQAKTAQSLTPITQQVPAYLNYPLVRASQGSLAHKDIFQQLRQTDIQKKQKKPDNPPPVPGSPGGSRVSSRLRAYPPHV